jgi:hypothetical protein
LSKKRTLDIASGAALSQGGEFLRQDTFWSKIIEPREADHKVDGRCISGKTIVEKKIKNRVKKGSIRD